MLENNSNNSNSYNNRTNKIISFKATLIHIKIIKVSLMQQRMVLMLNDMGHKYLHQLILEQILELIIVINSKVTTNMAILGLRQL